MARIMDRLNEAFIELQKIDSLPFLNGLPRFMKLWQKTANFLVGEDCDFIKMILSGTVERGGYNWCKDILTMKEHRVSTDHQLSYVIGNTYEASPALPPWRSKCSCSPPCYRRTRSRLSRRRSIVWSGVAVSLPLSIQGICLARPRSSGKPTVGAR